MQSEQRSWMWMQDSDSINRNQMWDKDTRPVVFHMIILQQAHKQHTHTLCSDIHSEIFSNIIYTQNHSQFYILIFLLLLWMVCVFPVSTWLDGCLTMLLWGLLSSPCCCHVDGLCSLTIDKALPEDEGQYKCKAENSAGGAECSCVVLVDGEYVICDSWGCLDVMTRIPLMDVEPDWWRHFHRQTFSKQALKDSRFFIHSHTAHPNSTAATFLFSEHKGKDRKIHGRAATEGLCREALTSAVQG